MSRMRSIGVMVALVCGSAAAGSAGAAPAASDIAGRWHADRVMMRLASTSECAGGKCGLTLDIVACGQGWCGIEVGASNTCGATALTFDAGKPTSHADGVLFSGKLELARGTEPYVIEAHMRPREAGGPALLSMTGDTGGEFRMFRRTFPFHATLARTGDAVCTLDKPLS